MKEGLIIIAIVTLLVLFYTWDNLDNIGKRLEDLSRKLKELERKLREGLK